MLTVLGQAPSFSCSSGTLRPRVILGHPKHSEAAQEAEAYGDPNGC